MKNINFDSPQKAFLFSLLLLAFVVGSVVLMFWLGQRSVAAFWHSRALSGEKLEDEERISYLEKAASLENYDDAAWRDLSRVLASKAITLAEKQSPEERKEQEKLVRDLQEKSRESIQAARRAVEIDSEEPLNWSNLGDVYLNLIAYAQGSAEQAVEAYNEASKYNPNDPSIPLRKAQAELSLAQRIERQVVQLRNEGGTEVRQRIPELQEEKNKALQEAEKFAEKSVEIKQNYTTGYMFLANLYDLQGKMDEAISNLSNVIVLNPRNSGLYFQLGLLHYKKDDLKTARVSFQEAVDMNPEYSNARYFLGLTYAREDNTERALEHFKIVAENNPENEEVKQIITNLEEDKPPLEGIATTPEEPGERTEAPVAEEGQVPTMEEQLPSEEGLEEMEMEVVPEGE